MRDDADQPPVAAGGDVVHHRREVARGRRDAAEHAHHAADVQRRAQHALVDERLERADVAEVEALVLGLDAELVHRLEQRDDLLERVREDHREHEVVARARVLRVVHRAHVQRGDLRLELAQVGDPLLDGDADRAGREVDDDVDLGADRLGDRAEVLDLVARQPVRRARVDVDHARALVDGAARLGRVLLRRVRDRGALVAVRDGARDRAGEQDGVVDGQVVSLRKWDVPPLTLPDDRRTGKRGAARRRRRGLGSADDDSPCSQSCIPRRSPPTPPIRRRRRPWTSSRTPTSPCRTSRSSASTCARSSRSRAAHHRPRGARGRGERRLVRPLHRPAGGPVHARAGVDRADDRRPADRRVLGRRVRLHRPLGDARAARLLVAAHDGRRSLRAARRARPHAARAADARADRGGVTRARIRAH